MSFMNTLSFSSGRKGDRTQGIMDTFGLPFLLQGPKLKIHIGNLVQDPSVYYFVGFCPDKKLFLTSFMNDPSFSSGRKGDRTQGIMDTFGLPSLLQGLLVAICVFLGNYIKVLNLYYLVAVEFRLCSFLFLE